MCYLGPGGFLKMVGLYFAFQCFLWLLICSSFLCPVWSNIVVFILVENQPFSLNFQMYHCLSLGSLENRGWSKAWELMFYWEVPSRGSKRDGAGKQDRQEWEAMQAGELPASWRVKGMSLTQTGPLQTGCTENMCWNSLLEGGRKIDLFASSLPSPLSHRSVFALWGVCFLPFQMASPGLFGCCCYGSQNPPHGMPIILV